MWQTPKVTSFLRGGSKPPHGPYRLLDPFSEAAVLDRRPLTRTLTALCLIGTGMSACTCDQDLEVIAPAIYVDACAEPVREIDEEFLGGFEECEADFGTVDISVRSLLEIRISNPTTIDLGGPQNEDDPEEKPLEVFLTENSDPAFRIEAAPDKIEAGLIRVPILISYRPTLEAEQTATLVIRSNAANVPDGQDVIIPIRGTGVDNGIPDIVLSPDACDFGRVAAGSVKECLLTIENVGTRALVFDDVTFLEEYEGQPYPVVPGDSELDEPFGFFGRPPAADDVVAAPPESNSITVSVRFTPDVLGAYAGQMRIATNDPDTPEIIVPLNGIGVDPPLCDVSITSVNGFPVNDGTAPTIEPLDDVIISAEGSEPSTASGDIVATNWEIVAKPPGSTAVLTNPTGSQTGFTFADVLGVDLAGRYRIRATVVDDLGTESVNECEVEFEAIPTDSVLAQLSWDTAEGDMDLHVTKKNSGGQFCPQGVELGPGSVASSCSAGSPPDDCYYANCKATSGSRPDWDEDGTNGSEGDPSLDIDDLSGYGPENINIDNAVEGEYLVGVDYFSFSGGAVGNTIRIYLYGQLQAEFFKELQPQEFWEVAVVHWPSACVDDLSTPALDECAE